MIKLFSPGVFTPLPRGIKAYWLVWGESAGHLHTMADMSDAEAASSRQQPAASAPDQEQRVKGEKASAWAHLGFAIVLLLTTIIINAQSDQYKLSKNLNYINIYSYKKSITDKDAAVNSVKNFIFDTAGGSWINDGTVAEKCKDLQAYWWPTPGFPVSDPRTATCKFNINLKLGPMDGQLQIKDVTPVAGSVSSCSTNTYLMNFTTPEGSDGTITGSVSLVISGNANNYTFALTPADVVLGYNFVTLGPQFVACQAKRQRLADTIHNATECASGFSSPLCTCVRAFTTRLTSWQSRLVAAPGGLKTGDVLVKGVQRCLDLRRPHDVRERTQYVYVHSTALLVFFLALFFNAVFNVMSMFKATNSLLVYVIFLAVYGVTILLVTLFISNGSGVSEFETTLAMVLPAFLAHGIYLALLKSSVASNKSFERTSYETPFLHPVTFDICLCALTLFTLVERGVVQMEYLVAEVLKCHVVAGVYIALVYYHCYGRRHAMFDSEGVQQAYLILYVVGLVSSMSSLVVPYAIRQGFEFHWLLPGVLTYVAFANVGWSVHLPMAAKLRNPAGASVYGFNAVAGLLILFVGCLFLSEFFTVFLQIYGAKHFAWPVQGDPLSYAAVRKLILPLGTVGEVRAITGTAL